MLCLGERIRWGEVVESPAVLIPLTVYDQSMMAYTVMLIRREGGMDKGEGGEEGEGGLHW